VLNWCVESVRKSGVVSIVGVYPQTMTSFPIGLAMQKALTIRAANCSHRKYMQKCFQIIKDGRFLPSSILTITEPFADAISAYQHFDKREPGWIKVELLPEPSK
jgi:threonine dehydrogenase-like Zn-dependent dehydrogenase